MKNLIYYHRYSYLNLLNFESIQTNPKKQKKLLPFFLFLMKSQLNYTFVVCTLFLLISPLLAGKCICNVEFVPVCACDSKGKNQTFSSACEANCANYTIAYNGSCIAQKIDNQTDSNESHANENIYNGTYLAQKQINSGYFGVVYFGVDLKTNESVAIKVEKNGKSVLKEASILSFLHDLKGVPQLFWSGTQNKIDVMVISLLGKDLISYLKIFKKFSLKTVVMLADQLLNILEAIHNKGVVHQDLKPGNFLMGIGDKHDQCFIVDFGLSKYYRYSNGTHIPYRDNKTFLGTSRYASIAAHNGMEVSRKDDLESLIYVLVFLYKGTLPWQYLKVSESEKKIKVGEMKRNMSSEEICKDMPEEFVKFLNYVKNLSFKQKPDYSFLKGLIGNVALVNNFQMDNIWDWIVPSVGEEATDPHHKKIGGLDANGFDSFLNITSQNKSDLNYKIVKMTSSSNLNLDLSSDPLKVPDVLNKSGDNSQNSSMLNLSFNNTVVVECPNTSILGFDLDERETEGFNLIIFLFLKDFF